ncbi:MAG TPA: hypothetical protein VFZ65_07475 [Planctomycetota bacterium]|nr:hypothetical protein [Planctomycetota bacterium]
MSDDRILAALRPVAATFDRLGIRFQIGGSVASSTFGMARSTLDVDLVADVRPEHADPIETALRPDFYVDAQLIRDAVTHRSCFNLIYLPAYFKVDVFVCKDSPYERAAFARSVQAELRAGSEADTFPFSTPEDVVLHKLAWFVEAGGNERQWGDLCGLLRAQRTGLDLGYLHQWAPRIGVAPLLAKALAETGLDRR